MIIIIIFDECRATQSPSPSRRLHHPTTPLSIKLQLDSFFFGGGRGLNRSKLLTGPAFKKVPPSFPGGGVHGRPRRPLAATEVTEEEEQQQQIRGLSLFQDGVVRYLRSQLLGIEELALVFICQIQAEFKLALLPTECCSRLMAGPRLCKRTTPNLQLPS